MTHVCVSVQNTAHAKQIAKWETLEHISFKFVLIKFSFVHLYSVRPHCVHVHCTQTYPIVTHGILKKKKQNFRIDLAMERR